MDNGIRNGKAGSPAFEQTANGPGGRVDLGAFLEQEVYPRLRAEDVFAHGSHRWQKAGDKWRGGCPWHESASGTAFYIDAPTLNWRCPACLVGGGPVQYLWKLEHGANAPSPRGADFVDVVRRLCGLAGVPFPERQLSAEEAERLRSAEARRAVLGDIYARCAELLWAEAGAAARAYLLTRGFTPEALKDLNVGLYPDAPDLRQWLRGRGHAAADIAAAGGVFRRMEGYAVFPWPDDRGRPLTLYGTWPDRSLRGDRPKKMALPNPKDGSGEDLDRTKRSPLYLDRALRAGLSDLVLVEGVTDAALAQARGDARVIACVGAQLSHAQTATLARCKVKSVTICLDPDKAGDNGIRSCVRQLLDAGVTPYVADKLPEGMDPDDFILARGLDAWKAHVARRVHGYQYEAQAIINRYGMREPGDDAWEDRIVEDAVAYARQAPAGRRDQVTRHFLAKIHRETGADMKDLRERCFAANGNGTHPKGTRPIPTVETFTAAELMQMELPPPRWAVEGILPEGLALLAGKPKLGKSWMMLDLALAVAGAGVALGKIEVDRGEVLYLALEDTKRRLKERLQRLRPDGRPVPAELHLVHECPRQDEGGLDWLAGWLDVHPQARLVVIDTWIKWRPRRSGKENAYDLDSADGAALKAVADRHSVSIVCPHHCRKLGAEDPVDEVSGSVGLTGACDAILVLRRQRGEQDAVLIVTGRDVEEAELNLTFDKQLCLWQLAGEGDNSSLNDGRQAILDLFAEHTELTARQVEALTGKTYASVRKTLQRMAKDKQLAVTERGKFTRPAH